MSSSLLGSLPDCRCVCLVSSLLKDEQLLDGLTALAGMPPYHLLPLAPWDPAAAMEAAEAVANAAVAAACATGITSSDDPALQAAVTAAAAAASFSQCNEVLYRLLVLPWNEAGSDGGSSGEADGSVCMSLAGEFERSSWSVPTLLKGELRPLTQPRVRRLYDEVRSLTTDCLQYLNRVVPLRSGATMAAGMAVRVDVADAAIDIAVLGHRGNGGVLGALEQPAKGKLRQALDVKARVPFHAVAPAAEMGSVVVTAAALVSSEKNDGAGNEHDVGAATLGTVEGWDDPS